MFNSKLLMKRWSMRRDKLFICIDDDKFHLHILRSCDVLKLSRHMRDNVNGLTIHTLATSGSDFKLSSECENPDDNVLSMTKRLITKTFSMLGTDMSVTYLALSLDECFWC